jgi:murein DD-endopeptidase MepM/ murein hydrolase activator NlpD
VALFGGLFGLAAIGTVLTFAIRFGTPPTKPTPGRTASSSAAAPRPSASASVSTEPEPPPDPGPWRVASLANEEGVKMISGKLGTRSLMTALEEEHVPKPQIFRILKAFDDPKLFDKPRKNHQFVVALDRPSKRVRGFEYQASATEVWQAKEVEEGRLAGAKLDLKIEQRRVTRGVVVDGSLKASLVEAGLDDDMVGLLDDALSDRVTLDRLGKGTRLRVVAQEQLVAGRFSRYLSLDALEYWLPRADKPTRLYHFRNGKMSGVYDAAGKAPYRTSWGPPLKVVRITSKFNPKRLHPVLHTVMPHNGTDFGAAMGTPVYAVAAGTVSHVGPHGPSGNLVLIEHPNGLESGYAHLSRFAQGLKKGDKVETQQLVGYVGSTGRSTGPHLHFSIKKAGVYIDAMTVLKLNQERVLPKSEREAFEAFRKEMDQLLDAIPLADAPPGEGAAEPDENEHRDDNNHGEEHEGEAAPAASGNAPPPPSGPEPPPAPPVTDDTTPESAVWRPD